jgi:hypothetical protein
MWLSNYKMTENKNIRFVGFSEAMNDMSDHLSGRLERTLDFADNMYMSHGNDAVEAVTGISDRDIADDYATKFVLNQLEGEEDEE